ncbi:UDP-N-acetylglucosamine 2-epimerase [Microbacterium sp. XT11]|nr:UDP-N-acetylglucosamine 2-epimerase [Microbacterium sp. XT11]
MPLVRPISVLAVYGTRPEAIKMAPLVRALRADPRFTADVVVTGQHGEMLDGVNRLFGIEPDVNLRIHSPGQTLTDITTRTLARLGEVLAERRPDAVLVQGDTSTTFVAALAATYAGIPVIHAEAGLRTGELLNPFPEEANRRLTTRLSSLHLTPTATARDNLLREGVEARDIVVTGNSVIDALLQTLDTAPRLDPALEARLSEGRPFVLVTAHRRESWGEPLRRIGRAIARLAELFPDHYLVCPLHANPLVRASIEPAVAGHDNVVLTAPQPYPQFCALLSRCRLVLTDSGGVQEEAPALGKPVLVMRDTTERPEAVAAGTAVLIGTQENAIVDAVSRLLTAEGGGAETRPINPYGDGHAAERTVQAIARHFGLDDHVDEFAA